MTLTDVVLRRLKPGPKTVRMADEKGLYLEVSPSGGTWWRLKYRFDGKEKRLALGVYPEVSLKEARERRDGARGMLRDGIDPGANRKARKTAEAKAGTDSFEVVAREWQDKWPVTPTGRPSNGSVGQRRWSFPCPWNFPFIRWLSP